MYPPHTQQCQEGSQSGGGPHGSPSFSCTESWNRYIYNTDNLYWCANWVGNLYKENEKVRKKERKHALDQENDQEKKKVFRLKNINHLKLFLQCNVI